MHRACAQAAAAAASRFPRRRGRNSRRCGRCPQARPRLRAARARTGGRGTSDERRGSRRHRPSTARESVRSRASARGRARPRDRWPFPPRRCAPSAAGTARRRPRPGNRVADRIPRRRCRALPPESRLRLEARTANGASTSSLPRTRGAGACGVAIPANPRANPARLAFAPRSPRRITASNASRANGSTPDAAIAPNITALTTVPAACASRPMSNAWNSRLCARTTLERRSESSRPSAIGIFSDVVSVRPERGDHHRAIGTHHAGLDDARGFEELRGDREIDAAGNGQQRQDRLSSAERSRRLRPDLDVIRRRAGALRDAGDRRALRRMSCGIGEVDQPFGEHAAAFSAERRDQDRDGSRHVMMPRLAHRGRSPDSPIDRARGEHARCDRSRQPGLLMTSPR